MKIILYLTDKQITVIDVEKLGQADTEFQTLSWAEPEEIEHWVAQQSSSTDISVILDFIDETLHYEWVPKLLPWEKPPIENRLCEKAKSEGAQFYHVRWLNDYQKNADGREEQSIMISSVYSTDGLNTLFTMFEEAQLSIVGVHSYSFLVEKYFLKRMASPLGLSRKQLKHPIMLVFRESKFSFRQLFFNSGGLRISRHIELDPDLDTDTARNASLIHETQVAINYLYNQKTIPFNSEIGFVYLNTHGSDDLEIKDLYSDNIALTGWNPDKAPIIVSDLYEILGADKKDNSLYGSIGFLVQFLVEKNLPSFYFNDYIQKLKLFRQFKQLIIASTVVIVIAGSVLTIHNSIDTFLLQEKLNRMEQKISTLQVQKNKLQDSIDLKYDAQDIKASVSFSESLKKIKLKGSLGFNVDTLGTILTRHPNILIEEIGWEKTGSIDSNDVEITLNGWVFPFNEAFESPVNWVDQLVEDFEKAEGLIEVILTKEPLDRKLQKALSVSSSSTETVNALPFEIKLKIGASDEVVTAE